MFQREVLARGQSRPAPVELAVGPAVAAVTIGPVEHTLPVADQETVAGCRFAPSGAVAASAVAVVVVAVGP